MSTNYKSDEELGWLALNIYWSEERGSKASIKLLKEYAQSIRESALREAADMIDAMRDEYTAEQIADSIICAIPNVPEELK